jgi:GH15 family glucan-1,4-alpha-glucosidase
MLSPGKRLRALIEADLCFILKHWREPCVDIWEEEQGQHYCTRLLHHAALADGACWMRESGADKGGARAQGRQSAAPIFGERF